MSISRKIDLAGVRSQPSGMSFLSRGKLLLPREVKAFMRPIRNFWLGFEGSTRSLPLDQLLAVERKALQEIAPGADLDGENLNRARRKVLSLFSSPDAKQDYIDFLLTLAGAYGRKGEFNKGGKVLEAIVPEDRGNWHVLKELAIVHLKQGNNVQASHYFAEAEKSLPAYRQRIEVEDYEIWETETYQASFRVLVAAETANVSEGELSGILDPFLQPKLPPGEIKGFYYPLLERTIIGLLERSLPVDALLRLFSREIKGEAEFKLFEKVDPVPLSYKILLSHLAAMEDPPFPERVFAVFKWEVGKVAGKKAASLYLYFRVGQLLRQGKEGRAEAKRLIREARRAKVAFRVAIEEIERRLREEIVVDRGEDLGADILALLDSSREGKVKLLHRHEDIGKKALEVIRNGSEDTKDVVRDEITAVIKEQAVNFDTMIGAILLANFLMDKDAILARRIENLFADLFAGEQSRETLRAMLHSHCETISNLAAEIAVGVSPANVKVLNRFPALNDVLRTEKIHDFFYVRLADIPGVGEVYWETFGNVCPPYEGPASLRTIWPMLLAAKIGKAKVRIKLLSLNRDNIAAQLEYARGLIKQGTQLVKAKKIINRVLQSESGPLATVRAYCDLIAAIINEINPGHKNVKFFRQKWEEAERNYSRAREAYQKLDVSDPNLLFIKEDWANINMNIGDLKALVHDFEGAHTHYQIVMDLNFSLDAVKGIANSLLMQGCFYDAACFLTGVVTEIKGIEYRDVVEIYIRFIESAMHAALFEQAISNIDKVLLQPQKENDPRVLGSHLDLQFLTARVMSSYAIEDDKVAPKMLRQARSALAKGRAKLDENRTRLGEQEVRQFEAAQEMVQGDILVAEGNTSGGLEHYRKAVELYSWNPEWGIRLLDAKWTLLDCLAKRAAETSDSELFVKVLEKGTALTWEYPAYPLARQVLIGPLISLGRDREALEHVKWLAGNLRGMTADTFANLILLLSSEREDVIQGARGLIEEIKGQMEKESFDHLFQKAMEIMRRVYPELPEVKFDW